MDYIPMSDVGESPYGESRLVREEDEDEEHDGKRECLIFYSDLVQEFYGREKRIKFGDPGKVSEKKPDKNMYVVEEEEEEEGVVLPAIEGPIPSVDAIVESLNSRLQAVQEVSAGNSVRKGRIETELKEAKEKIEKLDEQIIQEGVSYQFFQEMKEYILDLLGCLEDKVFQSGFSLAFI